MMGEWFGRTTPIEWATLMWATIWGLVKLGEWKREQERLRQSWDGAHHDELLSRAEMELMLKRHAADCHHEAQEMLRNETAAILIRQSSIEVELRKHRDWLIEAQAELGIRRKERT